MKVYSLKDIKKALNFNNDITALINAQKQAFKDLSSGLIDVPMPLQYYKIKPVY